MECLLCLNPDQDMTTSIQVDSLPWLEFNIKQMINKYLWSIESLTSNDFICSVCWHSLYDFHQFYTRLEEAHDRQKLVLEVGMTPLDEEDTKPEILQEILLEPEILINTLPTVIKQEYSEPADNESEENAVDAFEETPRDILEEHCENSSDTPKCSDIDDEALLPRRQQKRKYSKRSSTNQETKSRKTQKSQPSPASKNNISVSKLYNLPKIPCAEYDKFLKEHFKFNCDKCQKTFESFRLLCQHYNEEHQEEGYALCCDTKFFERRLLVDHVNFHLNPDYFKCTLPDCDKVFLKRIYLVRHMQAHEEKKHCCGVCGKKFVDKYKLDRHSLRHLPAPEKKIPCNECGKFYASEQLLTQHQRVVHLNVYARICEICGQTMPDLTTFKRHMEKHEGVPPPPTATCDICGLVTVTELTLRLHKKLKHPVDGKRDYICHICQKVSPNMRALKKHIHETHELGYQYKCTVCAKEFKRLDNFKSHMAMHNGTPLYRCPWCPKEFNSNGNMHQHRKKAHPVEWVEAQRKKYSGNLPPKFQTGF